MKTTQIDKWIPNVMPDDRTCDVAVHTLQTRLAAVQHYLSLAAEKTEEDIEYVHELRVWTRRAAAALELYSDFLPHRRAAWIAKQLKRLRHAANDARDYDVLTQRLAKDHPHPAAERWLQEVRAQRVAAQEPIRAMHKRLRRHRCFARRIEKLLQHVQPRGKKRGEREEARFGAWARTRLQLLVERYFQAAPQDGSDEVALHVFRIRGKQLRYVMELLAGAFPTGFREAIYPVVESMQDRLGEINDLAIEQARLRRQIDKTSAARETKHLQNLLSEEETHLAQARQGFLDWCTPQFLACLHAAFDGMLADSRPVGPRSSSRHAPDTPTFASGQRSIPVLH